MLRAESAERRRSADGGWIAEYEQLLVVAQDASECGAAGASCFLACRA